LFLEIMTLKNGPAAATLIDILRGQCMSRPDEVVYHFLGDGETITASLTFGELDRRAREVGTELQRRFAPGDRLLLVAPPGPEVISGFLGALYAGMIPVPVYPPQDAEMAGLRRIAADAGVAAVLTSRWMLDQLNGAGVPVAELFPIVVIDEPAAGDGVWQDPHAGADDLAFLQYTSGSTGDPKGVMVAHGGLLTTIRDIDNAFHHHADSVIVSWLPTFHDMGLIYGVLMPLFAGCTCYLMSPGAFLRRPFRWLHALSLFGGTHSAAPNFAYDLCVRKTTPEERVSLDLSRWLVASNGAEPIREATMIEFSDAFAPAGFRFMRFTPSYGLAEATLKVATTRAEDPPLIIGVDAGAIEEGHVVPARGTQPVRRLVGCGWSSIGAEIRIVDPITMALCPPEAVGEIWVNSPSVAKGYWHRPDETRKTFQAFTADNRGPFLRTGDLGFIYAGELFITGRLKDLIVLRGRNYYPQDIEYAAESSDAAIRHGCSAAFVVPGDGADRVVLLVEAQSESHSDVEMRELLRGVRAAVSRNNGVVLDDVVVLPAGSVPKTSSGKVRRNASREQFLKGSEGPLAEWHRP
jgi:acyl-CoA synthetase (AMP-forming)/AMP-acid ligase II